MKCVFTCSIFVDSSTKIFLSVLSVFGKYFVLQNWKFSKISFALFWQLSRGLVKSRASIASSQVNFGDLFVGGRSSCEGYSEIFASQLATPLRVDLPVVKNACLAKIGAIFKSFSVFPWTFVTIHLLSQLSPSQTLCVPIFKIHCCFISSQNHQEKVWVLVSSSHIPCLMNVFLAIWVDNVFETFFSLFDGYGWLCLLLLSSVFILLVTLCFSLFYYLPVADFQTLLINGFGSFRDLLHSFVCVL